MNKKQVSINIVFSLIEVVVSSLLLFFLYRYVIDTSGVASLGVWSLVLATTSLTRLGELGIGGSVVKYVAQYLGRNEERTASEVIQTAMLALALLFLLILPPAYVLFLYLLGFFINHDDLLLSRQLLPYALASLYLNVLISVVHSGLDGCQRIDIRKTVFMLGNFLYLGLSFVFIGRYGILGLAYSQVVQGVFVLAVSWLLLYRILSSLPLFPACFSRKLFNEIFRYGLNFQMLSIISLLIDPIIKALLSRYGGTSVLGYFEMANKMITKFRSLLVNANQVLVPVYAAAQEMRGKTGQDIYTKNMRLLMYISIPFYLFLMSMAPAISKIWIGSHVAPFFWSFVLLCFSSFAATINNPAYFATIGSGNLRLLIQGHLLGALVIVIMGIGLGTWLGYIGILIASCAGCYIGSLFIIKTFLAETDIKDAPVLVSADSRFGLLYLAAIACGFLGYAVTGLVGAGTLLTCVLFTAIFLSSFYKHPVGRLVLSEIRSYQQALAQRGQA